MPKNDILNIEYSGAQDKYGVNIIFKDYGIIEAVKGTLKDSCPHGGHVVFIDAQWFGEQIKIFTDGKIAEKIPTPCKGGTYYILLNAAPTINEKYPPIIDNFTDPFKVGITWPQKVLSLEIDASNIINGFSDFNGIGWRKDNLILLPFNPFSSIMEIDNFGVLKDKIYAHAYKKLFNALNLSKLEIAPLGLEKLLLEAFCENKKARHGVEIKRFKDMIKSTNASIKAYKASIEAGEAKIVGYGQALHVFSKKTYSIEEIEEEIKGISNHGGIKDFKMSLNEMNFIVPRVIIKSSSGMYNFGDFLVKIGASPLCIKDIKALRDDETARNGYYHPHIKSGRDICYNEYTTLFGQIAQRDDLRAYINTIIRFLHEYNPNHGLVNIDTFSELKIEKFEPIKLKMREIII